MGIFSNIVTQLLLFVKMLSKIAISLVFVITQRELRCSFRAAKNLDF